MRLHLLFLPLLLVALSACQALDLEAPTSTSDRAAYVISGADGVVMSATNALNAHQISSADAEYVSTTGHSLSSLVGAVATDPDPKSADARLVLAENSLKLLRDYLATHQKVK